MKRGSTIFLRLVVLVLGLIVLAFCIFALPSIYKGGSEDFPGASSAILAIICLLYATTIPFYIALWQTMKLLGLIDRNKAFSELSVKALGNIKRCAIAMTLIYMACVPLLYPIAEIDDAPGLLLFGFAFACAPIVIAVFAAVLQRLLKSAIEMKSENELTV
jgi:hypothetical protein